MTDRALNLILKGYEAELGIKNKNEDRMYPSIFTVEIPVAKLIVPTKRRMEHHAAREKYYQDQLNVAETELREKGVSIEVVEDPLKPGTYNVIASGNAVNTAGIPSLAGSEYAKLQAVLDPKLLDAVKKAKSKVIHHIKQREFFEKKLRAFRIAPDDLKLTFSVEEIDLFKLEPEDVA